MNKENVYLTVKEMSDGTFRVVDQDGRIVQGLRSLRLESDVDEPITFTAEFLDMRDGNARLNR